MAPTNPCRLLEDSSSACPSQEHEEEVEEQIKKEIDDEPNTVKKVVNNVMHEDVMKDTEDVVEAYEKVANDDKILEGISLKSNERLTSRRRTLPIYVERSYKDIFLQEVCPSDKVGALINKWCPGQFFLHDYVVMDCKQSFDWHGVRPYNRFVVVSRSKAAKIHRVTLEVRHMNVEDKEDDGETL